MAGYSDTPLARKLGIKEGFKVFLVKAPAQYRALLAPLPASVRFTSTVNSSTNLVHAFATERSALARLLSTLRKKLSHETAIWVSWPKKSSKVPTDITEDAIREIGPVSSLSCARSCERKQRVDRCSARRCG